MKKLLVMLVVVAMDAPLYAEGQLTFFATDNGDGTVTDNLTGLMWLRDANCIATNYPEFDTDFTAGDGRVTWQHALDFVNGINSGAYSQCGAGHQDWRLPNREELRSLLDYSRFYVMSACP